MSDGVFEHNYALDEKKQNMMTFCSLYEQLSKYLDIKITYNEHNEHNENNKLI